MRRLLIILFLLFPPAVARAATTLETPAKQAIIIDYDTGAVLFEKNADERMPTSSMSKVMTMYLVYDALKKGQISLETEFLVSEKAWRKQGSKMFVPVDQKVKVEDLIRGVVIQSGNDATIVLAEGLAGSEEQFAHALNAKAKELGMNNSNFTNASGWPDPEHYSTARDLATMAQATIRDFPDYYHYYKEKEFEFGGISQPNRNPLLYRDIGADGMKTGHTEDGGYGLIGTGVSKDGRRVIMVINGLSSNSERTSEALRLMQWGMNSFQVVKLFSEENNRDLDSAPVYLGLRSEVGLRAGKSLNVIVPKLAANDIIVEVEYNSPLRAPIEKGQEVGVVRVHVPLGDITLEAPLVTSSKVEEMSMPLKLISKARLISTGEGTFN